MFDIAGHTLARLTRFRSAPAPSLLVAILAMVPGLLFGPPASAGGNCQAPPTGLVPLTELPTSPPLRYAGYDGGLYPNALNVRPVAHEAAGEFLATHIVPRDAAGNPDPAGRIVLLTIGLSNTSSESDAFITLSRADALRAPAVMIVNGAQGGASADLIADPTHPYWSLVGTRLAKAGVTPAQVQVLWLKEALASPTAQFPTHAEELQRDLAAIARNLHAMFPNARQCFVSSRTYGGYAVTTLNPEPYAYESAFSVKWLIEAQIDGAPELEYDPRRGAVAAPWLSWGPYLWADGKNARADGLTWICSDFGPDGTHPSPEGSDKVASLLVGFFRSDPVTAPWYRQPAPTGVDALPTAGSWTIRPARPNPFTDGLSIPLALESDAVVRAAVYTADGRRLRTLADRPLAAGSHTLTWDGRDDAGRETAPGVYFVRVTGAGKSRTAKVTRIR